MTRRNGRPHRGVANEFVAGGTVHILLTAIPLITALSMLSVDPAPSRAATPEALDTSIPILSLSPVINGSQLQHSVYSVSEQGCKQQGNLLRCTLLLKSQEDKKLSLIANGTRVIDRNGNQFNAASIEVGGERSDANYSGVLNRVQANLVKDIPLRVNLLFPNVPTQLNNLSLVEVAAVDLTRSGGTIFTLRVQSVSVSQ